MCFKSNLLFKSVYFLLLTITLAGELTPDAFIEKVLAANLQIADTRLQFDELNARRNQLKSGWLPSLSYSLNSSQSRQGPRDVFVGSVPISQPATTYEYHSTSLSLTQQLFDYGNSLRKMRSVGYNRDVIRSEYVQNCRDLIIRAQEVFYRLAEAEEIRRLYEEELTEVKQQLRQVTDLVRKGVRPPMDRLRMDVRLNEIKSGIKSQEMEINRWKYDLAYLMKTPVDTGYTLQLSGIKMDSWTGEVPGKIPETDPILSKIQNQVRMEETELAVLQWDRLPDVYLNVGYLRGSSLFDALYQNFERDWNLNYSLRLSFPLFQNHRTKLKETQKRIRIERLKLQLNDEKRRLEKEYQNLVNQIRIDTERMELLINNISNQESIYRYERERYNSGLTEYREMTEANKTVLQSKQALISLKLRLFQNQDKLKVLSGKWDRVIVAYLDKLPD